MHPCKVDEEGGLDPRKKFSTLGADAKFTLDIHKTNRDAAVGAIDDVGKLQVPHNICVFIITLFAEAIL